MHIYGDLQRRRSNRRSLQEKLAHQIDMLIALAMLCTLVVGTTMSTIRSQQTFNHTLWSANVDLQLTSALEHVTQNCSAKVQYGSYGFGSFEAEISGKNLIDAMAVIAGMTRSNLIMAFVVLFFAYLNRVLVVYNVYFLRYRNYVFRKSTLTVVELFIALVGIASIAEVERESAPVREYLRSCGVTAKRTLPYGSPLVYLYVFYGIDFFGFALSGAQLLYNGLRKPKKEVVDEWYAEQYELIKPKEEIDNRKTQIIVAEDGTTLGRALPSEIEAIRAGQRVRSRANSTGTQSTAAGEGNALLSNNNNNIMGTNALRAGGVGGMTPGGNNRVVSDRVGAATPQQTYQQQQQQQQQRMSMGGIGGGGAFSPNNPVNETNPYYTNVAGGGPSALNNNNNNTYNGNNNNYNDIMVSQQQRQRATMGGNYDNNNMMMGVRQRMYAPNANPSAYFDPALLSQQRGQSPSPQTPPLVAGGYANQQGFGGNNPTF